MPKAPKVPVRKEKVVHPNSRKAAYVNKQVSRESRVLKSKADTTLKQEQLQQKLLWFHSNMDSSKTVYTKHELAELTSSYLERFDEQLEQISIANSVGSRQGKQHVSRETAINITKEKETQQFGSVGVEVPDLINGKAFSYFKSWPEEIKYHPNIKFRKSKRTDLKEQEESGQDSGEDDAEENIESDD